MEKSWVLVPPTGSVEETVIDRRTGRSWVTVVRPFEMAATVVTQRQWESVLSAPPEEGDRPQVDVTWRQAIEFCNELSRREGLREAYVVNTRSIALPSQWRHHSDPALDDWDVAWDQTASGYRLPTDAEWQVACRAGTFGAWYASLDEAGWYRGNSGNQLQPVGLKVPNSWGLYDTLGGVWEWCWDLYDAEVYGAYRIIRGGGWSDPEWSCRAGVRRKTNPTASFDDLGFRLARNCS
jgi:hypothetical protein